MSSHRQVLWVGQGTGRGQRKWALVDAQRDAAHGDTSLAQAIVKARQKLLADQRDDGFWSSDESDSVVTVARSLILAVARGRRDDEPSRSLARSLLDAQLDDGGWASRGGRFDLTTSALAYFALRLMEYEPSFEPLARARRAIRAAGGADAAAGEARYYLALFGQIPWQIVPMSRSASDAAQVLVRAARSVVELDGPLSVREIFCRHPQQWPTVETESSCGSAGASGSGRLRRSIFTRWATSLASRSVVAQLRPLRTKRTLRLAHHRRPIETLDEFVRRSWSRLAISATEQPRRRIESAADAEETDASSRRDRRMPQRSLRADLNASAIACRALEASGAEPSLAAIEEALCGHASGSALSQALPTAWATLLLTFVERASRSSRSAVGGLPPRLSIAADERPLPAAAKSDTRAAARRLAGMLLRGQCRDGGWAEQELIGDRRSRATSETMTTAVVLEALGRAGGRSGARILERAMGLLRKRQQADGRWTGHRGCDVTVTAQVLMGLVAAGVPSNDEAIVAGINWLFSYEEPAGGWRAQREDVETAGHDSPDTPSCPLATAVAILALVSTDNADHPAVSRAVESLLEAQAADGSWNVAPENAGGRRAVPVEQSVAAVAGPLRALSAYAVARRDNPHEERPARRPRLRVVFHEPAIA